MRGWDGVGLLPLHLCDLFLRYKVGEWGGKLVGTKIKQNKSLSYTQFEPVSPPSTHVFILKILIRDGYSDGEYTPPNVEMTDVHSVNPKWSFRKFEEIIRILGGVIPRMWGGYSVSPR